MDTVNEITPSTSHASPERVATKNWRANPFLVTFLSFDIGLFSGIVNWLLVDYGQSAFLFFFGAGLIFGIITLPWLLLLRDPSITQKKTWIVSLFWLFGSFLSYFVAVRLVIYLSGTGFDGPRHFYWMQWCLNCGLQETFVIEGLFGATIVALTFHLLFKRLSVLHFIVIALAGASIFTFTNLIGFSPEIFSLPNDSRITVYPPWQGIITMLLGYAWTKKS